MANSTTTQTINQVPQNRLGTERIGKLIKMYAVPSIISMLVNSLYNIVDQIFIGWGVGYLGNGATNIIFPITIVFAAFALMFGDGSSAYMSLMLGANKKTDAAKGVANGIILSVATSILFAAVSRSSFSCSAAHPSWSPTPRHMGTSSFSDFRSKWSVPPSILWYGRTEALNTRW